MGNKLIKDLNEEKWRMFVALLKIENIRVNSKIEDLIDEYISKNVKRLLK